MALSVSYMQVGKGFHIDSTNYRLYGVMFDPPYSVVRPSGGWDSFGANNTFSSVSLSGFQPGNEVCVCCVKIENTGSTTTANIVFGFQQYNNGSWQEGIDPYIYYDEIGGGQEYAYYLRVGIDPDEIRPDYSDYRFYISVNGSYTYKGFTVSNLSFDSTPHPAGYLRVEGSNLCYIPPSIYSGSSNTGYKHKISIDTGYSGSNVGTDKAGSIWIPSSSSDHHIYYVNEYGIVSRTKESYDWSGGSYYAGSNYKGYIRMTPSTSNRPEQAGYNYLCYIDGGGYKRRMGVGEV